MGSATLERAAVPSLDLAEVRRAAQLLFDSGAAHELRGLPSGRSIVCGNPDSAVAAAHSLGGGNVYYGLNPTGGDHKGAARGVDVVRRRHLLIDVDAVKDAGHQDQCATEDEKLAALAVAQHVRGQLDARGWPSPAMVDSGNGWHLLYRVDLPNDDGSQQLVKQVLGRLSRNCDTDGATVDTKVHDAPRIARMPGTVNRKGTATPERPHRLCLIVEAPEHLDTVTADMLDKATRPLLRLRCRATNYDPSGAWAQAALDGECKAVAAAAPGGRNTVLNTASYNLGQIVGGGALTREEVEERLTKAALACGLGEQEISKTLRSGIQAGMQQPRTAPDATRKSCASWPLPGEGGDGGALDTPSGLVTTCLAALKPVPIHWLVPDHLALGKLLMVAGDGGHGKSTWTLHLAAAVTRGWPAMGLTYDAPSPADVLLFCCEDDFEDTIIPRLLAAGADLTRVHRVDGIRGKDGKVKDFSLDDYLQLEEELKRSPGKIRLIVIDPAGAYIGRSGVDEHKDAELRTLLGPLATLAAKYQVTIILVKHLNKGAGAKAVHKVGGSVAYVNTVRAAWVIVPDEEDAEKKLFLPIKFNLGPWPRGLSFRMESLDLDAQARTLEPYTHLSGEDRGRLARQLFRLRWLGPVDVDADTALANHGGRGSREKKPEQAVKWLQEFLGQYAYPSEEVIAEGRKLDIGRTSLFNAKASVGIKARKFASTWWWGLGPSDRWTLRPDASVLMNARTVESLNSSRSQAPIEEFKDSTVQQSALERESECLVPGEGQEAANHASEEAAF